MERLLAVSAPHAAQLASGAWRTLNQPTGFSPIPLPAEPEPPSFRAIIDP